MEQSGARADGVWTQVWFSVLSRLFVVVFALFLWHVFSLKPHYTGLC